MSKAAETLHAYIHRIQSRVARYNQHNRLDW